MDSVSSTSAYSGDGKGTIGAILPVIYFVSVGLLTFLIGALCVCQVERKNNRNSSHFVVSREPLSRDVHQTSRRDAEPNGNGDVLRREGDRARMEAISNPPRSVTDKKLEAVRIWLQSLPKIQCRLDEQSSCPVCLDALANASAVMLPCLHLSHHGCLERYILKSARSLCPVCRQEFIVTDR